MNGLWGCEIQASWLWFTSHGWPRGVLGELEDYLRQMHSELITQIVSANNWVLIWCWVSLSSHWSRVKGTLWIQLLLDKTVDVVHWHLFQLSKISVPAIQVTGDKAGFKNWEGNLNMFQHLLHLEAEMLPAMWCVFSYAVRAYIFVCFSQ